MASVENGAAGASRRPGAPPGAEASRVGVNLLGAGVTEGTGVPGGRCPWGQGSRAASPWGRVYFPQRWWPETAGLASAEGSDPACPACPACPCTLRAACAPRAPPKASSASRVQGQRPRRRPAWCADSQPPFLAPSRSFSRTKSCNVPGVFPPILAAALRSRPRIPRGCARRCPGPARGVGLRPSPSPPPGWTQVAAVSPASPRVVCAVEGPAWRRTDLGLSRP